MAVLTKEDFRELEKRFVTKKDLDAAFLAQEQRLEKRLESRFEKKFSTKQDVQTLRQDMTDLEKRFDKKLSHAVAVLEQKIENSEQRILETVAAAMDKLVHRAEMKNLEYRVTTLERKVLS